jgi:SAM-dependent methyltransferase
MMRRLVDRLLESSVVYALWQSPFASQKFAPVALALAHRPATRVLDVGCGPGTNARWFADVDYVGVDINHDYLALARSRYKGSFIAADLETDDLSTLGLFDVILVNSVLHHLPDDTTRRVLAQLRLRLAPNGRIHVLELVLPAWLLAKLDRGKYPRPIEQWRALLAEHFTVEEFRPYALGPRLWSMVYFQGGPKS